MEGKKRKQTGCQADMKELSEKTGIKQSLLEDLVFCAGKHGIHRLTLFGSRAKGTYKERSDIDLFVEAKHYAQFMDEVDEELPTLLIFDFSSDQRVSASFQEEIRKTGIVIYEEN